MKSGTALSALYLDVATRIKQQLRDICWKHGCSCFAGPTSTFILMVVVLNCAKANATYPSNFKVNITQVSSMPVSPIPQCIPTITTPTNLNTVDANCPTGFEDSPASIGRLHDSRIKDMQYCSGQCRPKSMFDAEINKTGNRWLKENKNTLFAHDIHSKS